MRKRRIAVKTAMLGILVVPGAALAEELAQVTPPAPNPTPADPNAALTTLKPVTVTGSRPSEDFNTPTPSLQRVGGDVRDVPQSVTIINKALIQSQGATSLVSALRSVPGVTIGAAEGGQIGNNINLNGFSARTDLFLDGMRDRGQYYRDTFALEQVEVLMGASSMLFGRGSTGGVINQVLKKPSLKKATELTASVTTNGLVRGTGDVNLPLSETSAVRVATMFQAGSTSMRNHTGVLDFGMAPSVKFGIGTPTEITLSALLLHNKDQSDYGIPPLNGYPAQVGRNTTYGFANDRTAQDVISLGASIDHKFSKDLKLRNQTQFNYVNTDVRETSGQNIGIPGGGGGFTVVPQTALPISALFVRQQSRDRKIYDFTVTNLTELNAKFDTGSVKHDALVGLELGYDSYWNQTYLRTGSCNGFPLAAGFVSCTPLAAGAQGSSPSNATNTLANLATATARSIAGYVNDTIEIVPTVKVVAGIRYDIYDAKVGNSINQFNTAGNTTAAYNEQTIYYTSYRGGVIWQPTPEYAFYGSYSTSFNPSLEQLTGTTGVTTPLPPEENKSMEVGAKIDVLRGGNLSLTGALFQTDKNNARTAGLNGTFDATGQIRIKGARAGFSGRITDDWQVFGGWTYLDAKIVNGVGAGLTGNVPINTPAQSASIWTTYGFLQNWEVGGGVFYVGQRYVNNNNTVQVPEYYRVDLTAAYKMETFDVRLNVFNVLDTMYYDQLIASDGGRAVPGSGRTAMLTLSKRF